MGQRDFAENRYEAMPYRRCGRSGLMLPEISLGLWQGLGLPGKEEACREIMYYAFDHGMTHFDLANNYGEPPGTSEEYAGRILRDMPRDELIISSKAGYRMWPGPYGEWGSKKYLVASLDQSLHRLGLEYVDIFYHHRPDLDTPLEETLGALDQIVRQGKALYAGVSSYRGNLFRTAVETVRLHDWAPITIHQPSYSMLNRWIEDDLLPQTDAAGTGVIAFCPLQQGILTDRYLDGLPDDSRLAQSERGRQRYESLKNDGTLDMVRKLRDVARARGQSLAQMAITWLLRDSRVTSVLIGVSKLEQLKDNLAAVETDPLSEEELQRIEEILTGRN